MNRRRFLRAILVVTGSCALTCVGAVGLLALKKAPNAGLPLGFPDRSFGENAMNRKILVAYASADGSTGGVAETIGQTLADGFGAAVDVRPMGAVTSLEGYSGVVLGSAIHGGKWLPEAVEFLRANQETLRRLPTAFFLVGMMVASAAESNRNLVEQYLAEERALVSPVAEGRFAGALFPNKYPFWTGLGMRVFLAYCGVGLRGGDYRDPTAIRAWAEALMQSGFPQN